MGRADGKSATNAAWSHEPGCLLLFCGGRQYAGTCDCLNLPCWTLNVTASILDFESDLRTHVRLAFGLDHNIM